MSTHLLGVAAALAALLLAGEGARAQTCGARNTFRIANSHSGAGSELNVDTGWVTTLPLITPGSNRNIGLACRSEATCTVESDLGTMRITGTGSATNCATSGAFLTLDQFPQSSVNDTFTIVSTTLPAGTPVQLRLDLGLDGFATIDDPMPQRDFRAELFCGSAALVIANGAGMQSTTLSASVGGQYMLIARLSLNLNCQGLLGLGLPPRTSSFAADLIADFAVECITPGASVSSCTGRAYRPYAARVTSLGGGCGVGSPTWSGTLPVLGTTQTWSLQAAEPLQPAFVVASFAQPVPTWFGSCLVLVDLPSSVALLMGTTSGSGTLGFAWNLPASPAFNGLRMTTQPVVLQPSGPMLGFAQLGNAVLSTLGL